MTTYTDLTTVHPMWIPAAVKAAQQGNAKDLYRPPGYERAGYTVNYMVRPDGTVRWSLRYRIDRSKNTTIANWVTDFLPMERVKFRPQPVRPPAEPIRITSEGGDWLARVVIDSAGLPRPIPVMP